MENNFDDCQENLVFILHRAMHGYEVEVCRHWYILDLSTYRARIVSTAVTLVFHEKNSTQNVCSDLQPFLNVK